MDNLAKKTTVSPKKMVVFIQYDIPPLRPDLYTLNATQTIPGQTPGTFSVEEQFVVQGERFSFLPQDFNSVFPPDNSNGEYSGVLPHVVFNRRTLPWERALKENDMSYESYPWLAILLFNDGQQQPTIQKKMAQDLI